MSMTSPIRNQMTTSNFTHFTTRQWSSSDVSESHTLHAPNARTSVLTTPQQTKVSLTRADDVAVAHALTQLAHQSRRRVRDDGDDAVAAGGHHRQRHLIVTRQHTEMWRTVAKNVGDLAEVARRFLYRDDSRRRCERERRLRLDVAPGSAGHVVHD